MKYFKFNASGNDFVFFHAGNSKDEAQKADFSALAKRLCDRHQGIGADGLVAVYNLGANEFMWRFYNCDGSEANMCGNASRAAMLFGVLEGFVNSEESIFLHTKAGVIEGLVKGVENANSSGGAEFGQIASVCVGLGEAKKLQESFEECGFTWFFYDTGVPHLVTFMDDISKADMSLAALMRQKYNANVNFCEYRDGEIFIRTFERGVEGETLACGTGMCAAAVAYRVSQPINSGVKNTLRPASGEHITVFLKDNIIYFEGQVNSVFSTKII